jgi:hypothetical protein
MVYYDTQNKQQLDISLNSINQLMFVMDTCCVFFDVRTGFLNVMQKSLKGLIAKFVSRFTAWPEDALELVANKFLTQIEMESKIRNECVKMFKHFHTSVSNISKRYVVFLSTCC